MDLTSLAEVVPEDQRARVLALPAKEDHYLAAAIRRLVEAWQDSQPGCALALEYLLSVSPDVSEWTRADTLRGALNAFQRLSVAQGQPTHVADLELAPLTPLERKRCGTLARVVEKALWSGLAPESLIADVRHLLPETFVRVLGWTNLASSLALPVVVLLKARSGGGDGAMPERYEQIARQLFGYRSLPYVNHLAFAVATLMGEQHLGEERNQPLSISNLLTGTANTLAAVIQVYGLTLTSFDPDTHLMDLIRSEEGSAQQETRVKYAVDYRLSAEAQRRWSRAQAQEPQLYRDWRLPDVSDTHAAELYSLTAVCQQRKKKRRQRQVKLLEPHITAVFRTASARHEMMRGIHGAYTAALRVFQAQEEQRPVPFSYTLPDKLVTLWFIIWTPNLLSDTDQLLIARPYERKSSMRNSVVTEYVGDVPLNGTEADLDGSLPYFAEIPLGWYVKSAQVRLSQLGFTARDLNTCAVGYLRPAEPLNRYISHYTQLALASGRSPRILIDCTSIYIGVTYAMFVLAIGLTTGMRMHELQQLRADPLGSVRADDGTIHCRIRAKGDKGPAGTDTIHIIEARFAPLWKDVMDAHDLKWEFFEEVIPERGHMYGLTEGPYLLQGNRSALTQQALTTMLRFLMAGITFQSDDGDSFNFVAHFLRYLYGRTRLALGHEETDIQAGLGHATRGQSREYFQGPRGKATSKVDKQILQLPPQQSCWQALQFDEGRS